MKTKLEIIQETKAAYSNPSNRALEGGLCVYSAKDGRKCAIGRCLINPEQDLIGALEGFVVGDSYSWFIGKTAWSDDLLKEEYRGHKPAFWQDLQSWHDNPDNFTDTGISEDGEKVLNCLIEQWS